MWKKDARVVIMIDKFEKKYDWFLFFLEVISAVLGYYLNFSYGNETETKVECIAI